MKKTKSDKVKIAVTSLLMFFLLNQTALDAALGELNFFNEIILTFIIAYILSFIFLFAFELVLAKLNNTD